MTPDFREALRQLGWDQYDAAEHLSKGLRTINRYANGGPVPPLVMREIQRAIAAQRKPAPQPAPQPEQERPARPRGPFV